MVTRPALRSILANIASVVVVALIGDGHAGKTYTLTGPEVLTVFDKVWILSAELGRNIQFVELTEDQARNVCGSREHQSTPRHRDGIQTIHNLGTQWFQPSSRSLVIQYEPSRTGRQKTCNILKTP